jgi:iron(III) transport system substrate-binding protein
MTRSRPSTTLALGAIAATLMLAPASALAQDPTPTPEPTAGPAGSIVVYNAQHESLTQAWADDFSARTGITVILRNGSDTELGNQLVAEGAASPADVFLTENSPAMALVEQAGLFAPVDQATLDQVPAPYRPSSGLWTGIAARSTVLVYDPEQLPEAELPASLLDLQDPAWQGRWAASPTGADFQAIVSALLALEGEEATTAWLAGMKANFLPYQGNRSVMAAVNAGEVPAGVIYHYYFYGDQANTGENSGNVALHYFGSQDPGAFLSISGGGVLASSQNPDAAQAFLEYITGPDGQTILQTGDSFEYAIASGISPNPALVPLEELDPPAIDPSSLDSATTARLMTEAGIL